MSTFATWSHRLWPSSLPSSTDQDAFGSRIQRLLYIADHKRVARRGDRRHEKRPRVRHVGAVGPMQRKYISCTAPSASAMDPSMR